NKKVKLDGYTFDSISEANYYAELKLLKKAKKIKSFILQPRYILQESFKRDNKTIREISYIADFEIKHLDDSIEVVDVKGHRTDVFNLKEKMFLKKYPHKFTLIYVKKD